MNTKNLFLFISLVSALFASFSIKAEETQLSLSPRYKEILKGNIETIGFVKVSFPYVESDINQKSGMNKSFLRIPIAYKSNVDEVCSFLFASNSESISAYSESFTVAKNLSAAFIKDGSNRDIEFLEGVDKTNVIYKVVVCSHATIADFIGSQAPTLQSTLFKLENISSAEVLVEIKKLEEVESEKKKEATTSKVTTHKFIKPRAKIKKSEEK